MVVRRYQLTIIDDIFEAEYNSERHKKYYAQNREKELEWHKNNYQDVKNTLKRILGDKCAWFRSFLPALEAEVAFLLKDKRLLAAHVTSYRSVFRQNQKCGKIVDNF